MYYDGTKLLSKLDINNKKPEIYLCTSNRSAGKTTFFSKLLVNRFLKGHGKFGIIYRFNYELDNCAEKFFKDISEIFYNGMIMTSKSKSKGIYHELYLDGTPCGYAISINSADQIKKLSHLFSDINILFFDEFQSESNHYCDRELEKFISIHISIARGGGKQSRYLPVIMCSNAVTILNPYFIALGICDRLNSKTKFLKGDGYVLEQGYNDTAAAAQEESAFNRAFSKEKYIAYAYQNVYLQDNRSFIEKPNGKCRYLLTLIYENEYYAIREYYEDGIVYCSQNADYSFRYKISVTTADHQINYVMLRRNSLEIENLRYLFDHGCFRFRNMKCKNTILKVLSY